MEGLLLLVALMILVMPIVALVVALVASGKAGRSTSFLENLERELGELRRALERQQRRVDDMERARGEATPPSPPTPLAAGEPPKPAPAPEHAPPALTPTAAGPSQATKGPIEPPPAVPKSAEPPQPPPTPSAPPAFEPVLPKGPGLEERIGARLPVWIGSLALALAGIFLVKYSFDKGLLSPPVRVTLGVLFGAALLVVGELLRKRSHYVSQGLSAAGIADLYACFLAGVNLYHLIPPVAGFGLMILATAVAVLLSLRQGPLIAVIGLVGGFFTPYLIHTGEPRPAPLFTYLLLLQVGLLAVTRRRRWWPLAGLTLLAGMGWVAGWMASPFKPEHAIWLGLFILASVAAFLASGFLGGASEAWGDMKTSSALNWLSMGSGLVLMAVLAGVDRYGTMEWAFLGIMAAACLVLGRRQSAYEGLAWAAAGLCALLLLVWGSSLKVEELPRFLFTDLGMGALLALGAYACLWGALRPSRWAALSAASVIVFLLVGYEGEVLAVKSLHWGIPALALAALYLGLSLPVASRRHALAEGYGTLAALAVAVTTLVSLSVPFELEREWLAVAWALEIVALAWIARRLAVPSLRLLAWPLAGLVAARLLVNPFVFTYPTGPTPLFNWLLYGFGIPAAAFAVAAWLCHDDGDRVLSEALQWGAWALGVALVGLEVRQLFHPEHLGEHRVLLTEWGTLTVAVALYGFGLVWASRRWPLRSLDWGGKLAMGLALAQCGLAQVLATNPLWAHHPVGEVPVFNALLWIYGAPALLCLAAAWELNRRGELVLPRVLGVAALGLSLVLLTLEVRQAFQGSFLDGHGMANAEKYAYSIAWVLFGTALLVAGILKRGPVLRYASLAVMLLAVGKVFLYDASELKDLYRVFSFVGLGVSLLLLAYLYQRFVFAGARR